MKIENGIQVRSLLFWLLSPALVTLLAVPLLVGHVAVRLLIARMRRRPDGHSVDRAHDVAVPAAARTLLTV